MDNEGALRRMAGPLTRPSLRAAGLALPLIAFIGVTFVVPLATMLLRSVYDPAVAEALPETVALLREWDGESDPGEAVYAAAARELLLAREERTIGRVASRINRIRGGLRSVLVRTGRRLLEVRDGPWRAVLIDIDADWADPLTWHAIRTAGDRFTTRHYLNAVDLQRLPDGSIARQPPERRIYAALFWRTFVVSLGIAVLCLLLGYPVAYLIAHRRRPAGPLCFWPWCWCRSGRRCWCGPRRGSCCSRARGWSTTCWSRSGSSPTTAGWR